ncbi:MAG: hypothetical protein LQ342_004581 [Letrouitia transgressa]|nr:MAG: hypothetical protein LQ342_004581 [Letrouitia transgressa]
MAGVTPYLLTSLTTVALAWDINHADLDGVGVFLSGANAEWLLDIIEPIQIGYGAVIISFLGAIHWGLEWAKFGGTHGYKRYAIGVIAPAVAWPTILFPVEAALISQFLAFLFLYYTDARTVVQGWSPSWYTTYRFILTFFVGASLVLSLVGRGQIADKAHRLPDPGHQQVRLRELQAQLHAEEQQYIREQAAKRAEDEEAEEGDSLTEAEAEEEE